METRRNHNAKYSGLYLTFTALFCSCLIASNIAASKLIALPFGQAITSGALIFVISYILNDVVCEVYGYRKAKRLIWTAFGLNAFVTLFFQLTIALKAPVYFTGAEAYAQVLGNTPRMLAASFAAYLAGSFANAKIMDKLKRGKSLFVRCILSTLLGELLDSLIFVFIGFAGVYDVSTIWGMIAAQTALKTAYEIVVFPITKIVIRKVRDTEYGI